MSVASALRALWPHGDQHVRGLTDGIISAASIVFPKYGLTSGLVVAHFMAQASEECGAGLEIVENLNYSEHGLLATFPRHFTGSMAVRYAHNPRMIADIAYGGRMGNAPPPSDDGWNFRGRGLSQVTGADGYKALQTELDKQDAGIDIMTDPDLVCDPRYALLCGVADFILCGCLPFAERDDIVGVTKHLNGGLNGLSARRHWLVQWKRALGVSGVTASPPRTHPMEQTSASAAASSSPSPPDVA